MPPAVDNVLQRLVKFVVAPIEMVIFAAGFLLFMWGLVKFMWNVGEGGDQTEGKQHMIWGLVGMFLMVSITGIIMLIDNTLSLGVFSPSGAATDVNRAGPILDFGQR